MDEHWLGAKCGRKAAPILVAAIALVGVLVALRFEGRTWWCACGQAQLWIGDAWGSHNSQHLLDPYSFTHVLHGFVFWWVLACVAGKMPVAWRVSTALVLESLWEILENSPLVIERYRAATASLGYSGDTIANSLGDIASCCIGLWLARRLGWRWTAVAFAAIEAALLLTIRDSLLVNVVMLLHPVEAIKQWQLGG